jgi:predicted amidohydrolase
MTEAPSILAAALQLPISMDPERNAAIIEALVAPLPPHTFVVAPEGALSGYLPEPDFVSAIDQTASQRAIERVRSLCQSKTLHMVIGACRASDQGWFNSSIYFSPDGRSARYDKINLATSERGTFQAGHTLPVFDTHIDQTPLRFGIQMCREIRYPEQWRVLAEQGAGLIAYVNNAIASASGDAVWRAHMISRAAELQRYVIGANNMDARQTCPTMIVAPSGEILSEVPNGQMGAAVARLPLDRVTNWVLDQARRDVVWVRPA